MVKICSSCGLSIPDDAKFCSWCGIATEIVVPVAVAPPAATIPLTPVITPIKPVVAPTIAVPASHVANTPSAATVVLPATQAVTLPTAPTIAVAPTIPAIKPVAVPTVALMDQAQRRLRFCNRCGVKIPFGEARTYMGLVTCDDCFEKEPIPPSMLTTPTIPMPALAYAIPT